MRLLALPMLIGFALDPLLFFGGWAVAVLIERPLPEEFFRDSLFYWGDVTVVAASAALWWITRTRRVSITGERAREWRAKHQPAPA